MERNTPWPAGTPCWVDLMCPDPDAARLFYAGLFDWELPEGNAEFGGYVVATYEGKVVAGVMPMMPGMAGHPSVWSSYLATADIHATADAVRDAGGNVVVEPAQVGPQGSMAFFQDPTGAAFGAWQAGANTGVQLANAPSSLTWNELVTHDMDAAMQFYAAVFGVDFEDLSGGGADQAGDGPDAVARYAVMQVGGNVVAGIGQLASGDDGPGQPHWRCYFAVDGTDDAVDRVVKLGGSVLVPAHDTPFGRWADVADTTGAAFTVITAPKEQS